MKQRLLSSLHFIKFDVNSGIASNSAPSSLEFTAAVKLFAVSLKKSPLFKNFFTIKKFKDAVILTARPPPPAGIAVAPPVSFKWRLFKSREMNFSHLKTMS